eukprot:s2984_g8.t1
MLAKAVRFVASKKVVHWVCQRNYEGHAPAAFELVRQYEVEQSKLVSDPGTVQHFPLEPSRCGRSPCVGRAGRKWIESLKQNFRLSRKIMPIVEPLPLEEVKAKAKLPQVFLLNRRMVSAAEFAALTLPSGVHAWRRPTSWSTVETMLDILSLLAVCADGANEVGEAAPSNGLTSQIAALKQKQDELMTAKRATAKEMKAKKRQLGRVKKAVQKLSAADLAELVLLVPKAKPAPKPKPKAQAGPR